MSKITNDGLTRSRKDAL